jgi:hypothetical protein
MKTIGKKKITLLLMSVTFCYVLNAQTTIILQPDGSHGKDAYIDSRSNNNNYGSHPDFAAISWTNGGTGVDVRGLIDFDFSSIPAGVTINSASLSLYSYDSPANGTHLTLSGSNESVLSRVTAFWDEYSVTWSSQPSTTTQNQVFLPASTDSIQDYLNINVTNLVQDMINDPNNSHGFLLKLATEEYYRRMIFASSDNPDPKLHPKLEICYSKSSSISERSNANMGLNIFPNPTSGYITVDVSSISSKLSSIEIISSTGQIIERTTNIESAVVIDLSDYSKGIYFVKATSEDFISTKKIIIE